MIDGGGEYELQEDERYIIIPVMSGIIDISQLNTPPEKHELATAKFFAERGKDIIFIKASNIPEVHTPDILMDGLEWEIKSPQGKAKRTIETNFRHAVDQSLNIIFDLRRINLPEKQCIAQLEKEFIARHAKKLLVITKSGELLEYPQKS